MNPRFAAATATMSIVTCLGVLILMLESLRTSGSVATVSHVVWALAAVIASVNLVAAWRGWGERNE